MYVVCTFTLEEIADNVCNKVLITKILKKGGLAYGRQFWQDGSGYLTFERYRYLIAIYFSIH